MFATRAPSIILSAAALISICLVWLMLHLATQPRWLGLELAAPSPPGIAADLPGIRITGLEGPAALAGGLRRDDRILTIAPAGGDAAGRLPLMAEDLLEEPDSLPSYAALNAFFARQDALAALLAEAPVLAVQPAGPAAQDGAAAPVAVTIHSAERRPVRSLPAAFWMQIGVGLAGFWIGVWIWSLRRNEWATRFLALAGAGLMISAFPAAVYSTRELALPGPLFMRLSAVNHLGALTFGVGMIGLFCVYPHRFVAPRLLIVPPLLLGGWLAVDLLQLTEGPGLGFHLGVVLAMLAIMVLVMLQYRAARANPRDRAALAWLGLAVIVGAGAFVATVIAPNLLGLEPLVSQGEAFLFFLLVYVGVALGVARFRLFELDEWAFRILFYVVGVFLLFGLDALLIVTIIDERTPAFALSLLLVALFWLPLRDVFAGLLLRRGAPAQRNLFRQVMDVALTPPGRAQEARWRALLDAAFRPLAILDAGVAAPALVDDGLALALPGPGGLPGYRLEYAGGGRRLFSPRDLDLACELSALLANALDSRAAYEKGVAEERLRIARDIHDNIGVQLLGALHSRDRERKDLMIRETLTDLRDIVNNAASPDLAFEELLADLRAQVSEHLHAAGVRMDWQADSPGPLVLPLAAKHTLRSVIREAVQNVLRHAGAKAVSIVVRLEAEEIAVQVRDDGAGFDPETTAAGNGLANMRERVTGLGGSFTLASTGAGTTVSARFPLGAVRKDP